MPSPFFSWKASSNTALLCAGNKQQTRRREIWVELNLLPVTMRVRVRGARCAYELPTIPLAAGHLYCPAPAQHLPRASGNAPRGMRRECVCCMRQTVHAPAPHRAAPLQKWKFRRNTLSDLRPMEPGDVRRETQAGPRRAGKTGIHSSPPHPAPRALLVAATWSQVTSEQIRPLH